jgi:hypothetical protein
MDKWTNGQLDDCQTNAIYAVIERKNKHFLIYKWTNGQMDKWINGQMDDCQTNTICAVIERKKTF